eukprot:Gregarina_sp_Poly_1__3285@NODE_1941_length_3038_cov_17_605183_g1251_i0_p2_GENE_NODE_1941_length_3038_cov_17_605183_g1251_i0NODE_1941_length_3038_cov_17_605183_g1251_i0_p2_ORF_typecomplete_len215_score29_49_NODE_1941_length_3038_cov_17_605183_g1251_i092736
MRLVRWLFALPVQIQALPGGGGLFKKKFSSVPIAILPDSKGSIPPPVSPMIGKAPPLPLPPPPPNLPLIPPPIDRGPDFIHLQPVIDHQVIVVDQPPAAILEEPVMLAPPPPPPVIHMQMPPPSSAYIPPTYIDLPAPQKSPVIIHATPAGVPAVPNFLPTKERRVGTPAWYPVAVLGGHSKGQFTRVGRIPSKEGLSLPNPPVQIRPAMKGEI